MVVAAEGACASGLAEQLPEISLLLSLTSVFLFGSDGWLALVNTSATSMR